MDNKFIFLHLFSAHFLKKKKKEHNWWMVRCFFELFWSIWNRYAGADYPSGCFVWSLQESILSASSYSLTPVWDLWHLSVGEI